ncbi:MAG: nuclear transport factor 2 family protein [Rhodoferax sp.]|nr:nuclear transport factor 2 family protein [Rhodoferax sp.]MCB2006221.1 nuclear transport factor 2 family protein [Rhodoferax sp.]MCB2028461.1 nuclear transport factor 2 family protein [Rhodoferax sp.]MCB2039545.1 nuclear transport factor 2 family protein [Rhodoferax sp.]MCP5262549.1 nuclear transport factor 2 family protein [Rhodoferax sp.]
MPVISITLLPGYSKEAESTMVRRVALAARSVIAAPAAGTTVFVHHASTYQRDGKVFGAGGAEHVDAARLVRQFLDRMERRDLDAARQLLAPDFAMRFPGSPVMHRLEELVQRSRASYRDVAKTYERFDESWTDDGTVVTCFGTLHGHWLDGSAFDGIRFIDRFEVADGLIRRQDVWNDLALHKPTTATTA